MAGYKSLYGGTSMCDIRGWLRQLRDALRLRVLLTACVVIACVNASAQTTGTLLGIVSDQNGAVVPSATVRAQNTDTGFTTSTTPTPDGSYVISLLPVGHYTISVEASGFKTFIRSGVLIPVAQSIRVDVKLEVGQVAQTVTVSGSAVNIDTTDATLGMTVDTAHLESLPLNGRNAMGLLETLPGVATATAPTYFTSARSGPSYSISGSRTDFGNMMLDGQTLTDAISNTNQNLPTVDALEEFRVLTDSYGAEYGRAGGSVIVAITKSGTNQFHGSLWEYLRNDAFDAANSFTPSGTRKPELRQNQFGGALGGPVLLPKYNGKNRTFFFVAYEGLRIRQQDLTVAYPLTSAERTGDFSALLPSQVITDPDTGLPFPGNIIPGNKIDTVATTAMGLYLPLPNQPDNSLRLAQSAPVSTDQAIFKIDQTLGDRDRVWFRFYRSNANSPSPEAIPFFNNPGSYKYQAYAVAETHTFSPNLINEAQASYSRPEGISGTEKNGKSAKELGINTNGFTPYPQTPQMSVSGAFEFGTDWYVDEPSYFRQFDDTISWNHGKHDIRAGFMFNYQGNGDLAYPAMGLSFTGLITGNPSADFLIGRPQSFNVTTTIIDDGTSKLFQPFVQDNYKVTKRLTLNLGLRYDFQTPWVEKAGGASTYRAGQQSTVYPSAPPGLVVPGDKGVQPGLYKTWKWGFEPRIGLAWDVTGTGQTSVRAAWGIFHAVIDEEVEAIETNNEPFLVGFSTAPPNTANPWGSQTDPLPYNPKNPSFGPFPGITQSYLDPNYRQADIQQFNLSIQRRIGANLFAEAAYVGTVSHHLYDSEDLNAAIYSPGATEANAQSRRPILPQYYGSMPSLTSDVNANYHSLQLDAQKRFSSSYAVQVAYTWEKSIDTRSQSLLGTGAQDPNNVKAERGLSDFNVGQILAINGLWDLPALTGRGFLTAIAGGWRLSGIIRYNGGTPQSILSGEDNALIGYCRANSGQERADIIGSPNLSHSRSRRAQEAEYFNTASFSEPNPGQFGTVGRNTIVGPGNLQNDIAVMKKLPTFPSEKGGFTFRADFFNLINWTNLGQPNNTLNSSAFGQITSAGPPRIAQFALRYDF
jgi:hypothetical protein